MTVPMTSLLLGLWLALTAPPPATDPNVGYPPGVTADAFMGRVHIEEATFTINTGNLQTNRLRFTIDPVETSFDVFLANGTGSGSVTGALGDHNVHFTQD